MKLTLKIEETFDVKYLYVNAGVRYWEDSSINGVDDTEDGENIPCKDGDRWKPIIDIDNGQIVNWEKGKTADIHYKVCDDGIYQLTTSLGGQTITTLDGYVLDILSPKENGFGDYIIMDIDENGFIDKWDKELISEFQD